MSHLFQSLTFESFALDQVEVISLPEDAVLEASTETLQIAVVNVEDVTLHYSLLSGFVSEKKRIEKVFSEILTLTQKVSYNMLLSSY